VIGGVAFAVGAVASAVAIPLGEHVMSTNGNYIFPTDSLTAARVIVGSGALIALTAVAVLGIGTILRRSAGAILADVVVFVLPTFTGPGIIGPTSSGGAQRGSTASLRRSGSQCWGFCPDQGS
jgi:hypothetical protein